MRALRLRKLSSLGRNLLALAERRTSAPVPNWRDLLPDEAFKQR